MKKLLIAILILVTGCGQIIPVEIDIDVAVRIVPLTVPDSPLSTPVPGPRSLAPESIPMAPCEDGTATWVPDADYAPDEEGTCWCFEMPGRLVPVHPEFPPDVTWVPADEHRRPGSVCWCWNVSPYSSGARVPLPNTGGSR